MPLVIDVRTRVNNSKLAHIVLLVWLQMAADRRDKAQPTNRKQIWHMWSSSAPVQAVYQRRMIFGQRWARIT